MDVRVDQERRLMAEKPARPLTVAVVRRVERITPNLVRVVVGGDALAAVNAGAYTDEYVKVQFPLDGVVYPEPFDVNVIRESMPREHWPVVRTYTIRRWIPEVPEMWIDFVVHGDVGVAGPWAVGARPGDPIYFSGPGGKYAPSATAGWHLLVGDESALPAIAAALERMPEGASAKALIEVHDAADEQTLDAPDGAEITWIHRGDLPVGEALVDAVQKLEFPSGDVDAFVHGEADFVKELRRHLRLDRGLTADQLSISGYWRRGMNEDGWQSSKREWDRQPDVA
jgi:NADPH-dependent ferric siderophore reductase